MTVIVLADRDDIHADCVTNRVQSHGGGVIRISPIDDFSKPLSFSSSKKCFTIGGVDFCLEDVTGVYSRVTLERLSEHFSPRSDLEKYRIEEEASAWLSILLMIEGEKWINDPRFELWADVKPVSLLLASSIGISVPNFIITNSSKKAKKFVQCCASVVKPISDASIAFQGGRYVSVPDLFEFDAPGTRKFQYDIVDWVRVDGTPFMLQSYVPRTSEYRVTVIDDFVFSAKAEVPIDRVDIKDDIFPEYIYSELPRREADLILVLTKALGLRFCTFDILLSTEGDLELVDINPSGNWVWLDELFDGDISNKISKSLIGLNA